MAFATRITSVISTLIVVALVATLAVITIISAVISRPTIVFTVIASAISTVTLIAFIAIVIRPSTISASVATATSTVSASTVSATTVSASTISASVATATVSATTVSSTTISASVATATSTISATTVSTTTISASTRTWLGRNVFHFKGWEGAKIGRSKINIHTYIFLETMVHLLLRPLDKRHNDSACSTPGCTTATMLVRLTVFWRVVMNHTVDAFNIQTSCSNVSSNKSHAFSMLESLHSAVALSLGQTTVQSPNTEAVIEQFVVHPLNTKSGAAEYYRSATITNQFSRNWRFFRMRHEPKMMFHICNGNFFCTNLKADRFSLVTLDQIPNFVIECGTEKDGLSVR